MAGQPNILLISVDALGVNRLGCYGGAGSPTPCLDSLASGGVLLESFFTSAVPAAASMAGLISGQHPVDLGLATKEEVAELPFGSALLPQPFLDAGYLTCAFDNLRRQWHWFGRGWEFYVDPGLRHGRAATGVELNRRVTSWLRTNAGERFFLTVHYQDPDLSSIDAHVRELMTALGDLRLQQKTLVVFVANAGEGGGSGVLADQLLQVPLIFNWPGHVPAGRRLKQMFQTEDLTATLLEAAGLSVPSTMKGQRFWKLVRGEDQSGRDAVISANCAGAPVWSIRTSQWKLVLSGLPGAGSSVAELFDLAVNPAETRNVIEEHPQVASKLEPELVKWITASLEELARNESLLFDED